jgi:AraC-like DNA-binding protein
VNQGYFSTQGGFASSRPDETAALLERTARMYALATNTACHAVDPEGRIFGSDATSLRCGLCASGGEQGCVDGAPSASCDEVLRYGMLQAERFGGAYLSFCPNSLLITTAIVRREAEMAGALVAGPCLLVDKDELISEEFAQARRDTPPGETVLTARLDTMPRLDTTRAKALADMLEAAARDASAELEGRIDPRIEASRRNAKIAEYIQSLKAAGFDSGDGEENLQGYPFEKEKELVTLVTRGDKAGARKILNEILGAVFFEGGGALQGVRARALELVVLLSRAAVEGGATAQEVFGASEDFIKRTASARTIEDLASWLAIVLNRFTDFVFTLKRAKHADTIRKAERFIKERFRSELTLEEVAKEVGLSPSYFSSVFKNEVGTGFAAYLNEVRIFKSKDLLKNRGIPIVEVAGMVGFLDQSYFSRVFKSLVGVAPGAYRNGRFAPDSGIEIHGEND